MISLQEFTGETEVERIADKFIKSEVENFGCYMYINDLNRQMEALSNELMKLHIEIGNVLQFFCIKLNNFIYLFFGKIKY